MSDFFYESWSLFVSASPSWDPRERSSRSRKLLGAAQPRCRECATVRKGQFRFSFILNSVPFDSAFPTSAARVRYGLTVPYTTTPKLCKTSLCPGKLFYFCK